MGNTIKVAVVTGAGTGIGKASALALAAAGLPGCRFAGRRKDILNKALAEAGGHRRRHRRGRPGFP